jgi:hypothetical protein
MRFIATPPSRLRAQALHVIAEFCFANKLDDAIHFLEEALACAGDDCGYAAQLEIALEVVLVATLEPARAIFTSAGQSSSPGLRERPRCSPKPLP